MLKTTDRQWDAAIAYAAAEGTLDGAAAASWVTDGNTTDRTFAWLARGIDDGDPEVLDTLPQPDLSGQWADARTGPQLMAEALRAAGIVHADGSPFRTPDAMGHAPGTCAVCDAWDAFTEVCDAYDLAFGAAVQDAVRAACTYHLLA